MDDLLDMLVPLVQVVRDMLLLLHRVHLVDELVQLVVGKVGMPLVLTEDAEDAVVQRGRFDRVLMFDLEAEHGPVLERVLDRVRMEQLPILLTGRAGELPLRLLLVLVEDRRAGEPEPGRVREEAFDGPHPFRTKRPVTLIDHEDDMLPDEFLEAVCALLLFLLLCNPEGRLELLTRRDYDRVRVRVGQERLAQLLRARRPDDQTVGCGVPRRDAGVELRGELRELARRLAVEVLPVDQHDGPVDPGLPSEEFRRHEARQGLSGPGRVPDESRLMSRCRRKKCLDGMDLIRMKNHERLVVLVLADDRVVSNQAVRVRNVQHLFHELVQVIDFPVVGRTPTEDELPMHVLWERVREVARRLFVRDNEQLERREDVVSEQTLFRILLDLVVRLVHPVLRRHLLQLDLDDREAVDEERHIETTVTPVLVHLLFGNLMDDLIRRDAAPDVAVRVEDE